VKQGVPFSYDSGRGGSRQTDACDYIFCIWRPDKNDDLSEDERISKAGEYKLALGKNRYGASTLEHCYFDESCLRIVPMLAREMDPGVYADPLIEISAAGTEPEGGAGITAGDDEEGVPPELRIGPSSNEEMIKDIAGGDAGRSAEALEALAAATDKTPKDSTELLQAIADDSDDIDPDLRSIFES